MLVNLVPFPRIHFLNATLATGPTGMCFIDSHLNEDPNVLQMIQSIQDGSNNMCKLDPREGRYFTALASCRGNFSSAVVESMRFLS